MSAVTDRGRRPLLGLRSEPGRVALWFMRLPRPLYHHGWGWLLGRTFLLITHEGRTTGKRRETMAMALAHDPKTDETVVCSAWGPTTQWMRNLQAHPRTADPGWTPDLRPGAAFPVRG